jgi:8-oxo-dGTP diphosphatase
MNYRDYDTRVSSYGLVVDDDRALLALWNESPKPKWTVPGGGLEAEETVEEALVREVEEETGYSVEPGRLLGIHSFWVPAGRRLTPTGRGLKVVRAIFDAVIVGGSLTNELDGSTDEARWIPIVEIPKLPHVDLVDIALEMHARAR